MNTENEKPLYEEMVNLIEADLGTWGSAWGQPTNF